MLEVVFVWTTGVQMWQDRLHWEDDRYSCSCQSFNVFCQWLWVPFALIRKTSSSFVSAACFFWWIRQGQKLDTKSIVKCLKAKTSIWLLLCGRAICFAQTQFPRSIFHCSSPSFCEPGEFHQFDNATFACAKTIVENLIWKNGSVHTPTPKTEGRNQRRHNDINHAKPLNVGLFAYDTCGVVVGSHFLQLGLRAETCTEDKDTEGHDLLSLSLIRVWPPLNATENFLSGNWADTVGLPVLSVCVSRLKFILRTLCSLAETECTSAHCLRKYKTHISVVKVPSTFFIPCWQWLFWYYSWPLLRVQTRWTPICFEGCATG